MAKIHVKQTIIILSIVVFLFVLFIPSDFNGKSESNQINVDFENEKIIIDNFESFSVIEGATDYTKSDDFVVTQFLDSLNIDSPLSTERFGIQVNTILFDSQGNQYSSSNIVGISELSLSNEDGILLDLGSIQTSFIGVTKDKETSVNIWGTVEFWLDDTLIDTKRLWASSTAKENLISLSIVDDLSFVNQDVNYARISQIETEIGVIRSDTNKLQSEIIYFAEQNCVNCNGRDTEIRIRNDKIAVNDDLLMQLNSELAELKVKLDKRVPVKPYFSDRDTNFTFTLSDEGTNWVDKSNHYYRVVLTEIHANLDSDNDFKEFSYNGEFIAYELKTTVDESKISVLDPATNKAIQIFKSDIVVTVNSPTARYSFNTCCGWTGGRVESPMLPVSFEFIEKVSGKSLGIVNNNSFRQNEVIGQYVCGGYPKVMCGSQVSANPYWNNPILTGIPRGTDLLIKISDGQVIEYKTPTMNQALFISCDGTHCTSNFGYSN